MDLDLDFFLDGIVHNRGPDGPRPSAEDFLPWPMEEVLAFLNQACERADAFLFGRRTYEIFAGCWGAMADPGDNPVNVYGHLLPSVHEALGASLDAAYEGSADLDNVVAI